jgi:hypothetical protein
LLLAVVGHLFCWFFLYFSIIFAKKVTTRLLTKNFLPVSGNPASGSEKTPAMPDSGTRHPAERKNEKIPKNFFKNFHFLLGISEIFLYDGLYIVLKIKWLQCL